MRKSWMQWVAILVVAGCSDGSARHTPDSQLTDATADSAMPSDGSDTAAGSGEVVATGMTPWAVTVDATTIYWSDIGASTVSSAPIAGGTPTTLATNVTVPTYVATDATSLYWGLASAVVAKIPLAGGTPVTIQASNNTNLTGLALDDTNVFHTEDYTVAGDCSVVVEPKAGGTRVTLAAGGSWNHPTGIAVANDTVFWGVMVPGAILKVPAAGGATTTLASGIAPGALAADATNLYWIDATGAVMKVAQTGGTPVTLATIPYAATIAVDGTNVYYATRGFNLPSSIYKVPIAGGAPTTLASNIAMVNALAVDATNIYWTENTGAVRKAPK